MELSRRHLLFGGAAALAAPSVAFASAPGDARLILLILRGGLDGLAAVPPHGDPDHARARGAAAVPAPGSATDAAVDLDGSFGLHPALAPLRPWWDEGCFGVVHAAGLAYRERSHFDAQNALETGASQPFMVDTGWLNRAVGALGGRVGVPVAMSRTIPQVLRGDAPVSSADPLRSWVPEGSLLDRVADLYAVDAELGPALQAAMTTQDLLDPLRGGPMEGAGRRDELRRGARIIGAMLAATDGPRIAVAEAGGWDTHTRQAGALDTQLRGLAGAFEGLRAGLGTAWGSTVILAVSEFGRTVHANGTEGTDHGTGGVVLLAGGGVPGGRVLGSWPGLAVEHQLDGRDLRPTTDVRAVFKGVLRTHLLLDEAALEDRVFPGTASIAPLWG